MAQATISLNQSHHPQCYPGDLKQDQVLPIRSGKAANYHAFKCSGESWLSVVVGGPHFYLLEKVLRLHVCMSKCDACSQSKQANKLVIKHVDPSWYV